MLRERYEPDAEFWVLYSNQNENRSFERDKVK